MATAEDAASFLNDVKTIFGIPNCCFALSVSEDALATFERRGLPVRNALDSSLDDVVRVDYLDWKSARWLLVRRVARVPVPFWGLCYCLSGGLPRDLVRAARNLFDAAGGQGGSLTTLCRRLVHSDVQARADGQIASLRSTSDSSTDAVVRWLLGFSEIVEQQMDEALPAQLESFRAITGVQSSEGGQLPSVTSTMPFVSYLGLSATLCDVFIDSRNREELEGAENPDDQRSFDRLAGVRRRIGPSPRSAWEQLELYRDAWRVRPLAAPSREWGAL